MKVKFILKDKILRLLFLFGLAIISINVFWVLSSPTTDLPVLGKLPEFKLIDQSGDKFSLVNLKGKIWVADFIFTTCAGPCPVMTSQFADIQHHFFNEKDVNLLSISVNPEYDAPPILIEYGDHYDANYDRWVFLTGDREEIHRLAAEGFHIGSMENPVFHSTRFVLLDKNARIRGYYISSELEEMQRLWSDIVRLTIET